MPGTLPPLTEILLVAVGSALGAMARFALGQWLLRADFSQLVAATLGVNLSGCAAAGFLAACAGSSHLLVAGFLVTGFLGSYTTVSSFSLETLGMWQSGRRVTAAAYVLVSTAGGLLLARAGWLAGTMAGTVS